MQETGVVINPDNIELFDVVTEDMGRNLILCIHHGDCVITDSETDGEIEEYKFIPSSECDDLDWAFPLHKKFCMDAINYVNNLNSFSHGVIL